LKDMGSKGIVGLLGINIMNEASAKKLRCCGPPGCGTLVSPPMQSRTEIIDMHNKNINNVNAPRWCIRSECHGWVWTITPAQVKADQKGETIYNHTIARGHCGYIK